MNTDLVIDVSDRATDELDVLFNSEAGLAYLRDEKRVPAHVVQTLAHFGFSAIANVIAAIKVAKLRGYGADDAIITIATDAPTCIRASAARRWPSVTPAVSVRARRPTRSLVISAASTPTT